VGRAGEMVGMPLKRKPRLNTNKALSAKALRRIIQIASIGGRRGSPDDWVGGPVGCGWLEVCLGATDCHVAASFIWRKSWLKRNKKECLSPMQKLD